MIIENLSPLEYAQANNVNYRTVIRLISCGKEDTLIAQVLEKKLYPKTKTMRQKEKDFYFYCMIYRKRLLKHFDNPDMRKKIKEQFYKDYVNYGLEVSELILDNGWERYIIQQVYN